MKVDASVTLRLEGEDVLLMRALVRQLPPHVVPALPMVSNETFPMPHELTAFAQRVQRAVFNLS